MRPKGSKNKIKPNAVSTKNLEALPVNDNVIVANAITSTIYPYSITVKILGKLFTGVGATFEEAFDKLTIRSYRAMSIWTLEYGGKKKEKIVTPQLTAKLFGTHGTIRNIVLNQFKSSFGI